MPGITNPAEEYFKDGLWAWDPAGGVWLKLIIDPLTNRLVIDHPGDLEVVQPTPADLCVANHGWDGSAWRKLPLVFGYSDRWTEKVTDAAVGGGDATANTADVDAGYIYVLQAISVYHNAGANKHVQIMISDDTVYVVLLDNAVLGTGVYATVQCAIVLKEDDFVRAWCGAPGDTKTVQLEVWGYKMKIAE